MVRSSADHTDVKRQPAVKGQPAAVKSERQLTAEEHWEWHAPHIRNWRGEWKIWKPVDSDALQKSFKSVRSFQFKDAEKSAFDHVNDWYEEKGDLTMTPLSGVTWEITRKDHSLSDGIMHPARPSHRVLCVNPKGEGAWVQQQFKGPQEGLYLEAFISKVGMPFSMSATWHVSRHEVKRVLASYDETGRLLGLSGGDYTH
ncbi:unnamed protein product [Closterium sp. NIES-65]|nr:unnamed protein product [Closterium sp. NIES-65]CAI5988661.1 unnamed protein product [Closterium sp. NIES-65]